MKKRMAVLSKKVIHYTFLVIVCSLLTYQAVRTTYPTVMREPAGTELLVSRKCLTRTYEGVARVNGQVVLFDLPPLYMLVLRARLADESVIDYVVYVPEIVWLAAREGQPLTEEMLEGIARGLLEPPPEED